MNAIRRYVPRYTYDDYARWEGKWELWDGVAISMSPSPFGRHQRAAKLWMGQLESAIGHTNCDAEVIHELDWIADDTTVLRPDVMVVCGQIPEEHLRRAPGLVLEVLSDSTRDRDLGPKHQMYQDYGVAVYMVVDPITGEVSAWQLIGNQYKPVDTTSPFAVSLCNDCKIELDTSIVRI